MNHLIIYLKSLAALLIVWFTDIFILNLASLAIFSVQVKEGLADMKDLISILVSLSILVLTLIKIKNTKKNDKGE